MLLRSVAFTLLGLSLALPAGPPPDDAVDRMPASSSITTISDSAPWTRRIEWALGRFDAAGLQLPPVAITVHEDASPCGGNSGRFRPGRPVEVHLCSRSSADSTVARLITLHELAHAWAETQLTAAERDAFLELRELDAWIDPQLPRHEWGAEHAAEVVSWGLMDAEVPIIRINDAQPTALEVAFRLLVARPPLWISA